MKLLSRSFLLLASTVAAVTVPLLAPVSASAILIGAESNGELVNSNRTPALQAIALDKMRSQGTQVVRGNWGWNEVSSPACATQTLAQLADHTNACYNWSLFDSFVSQANARGMQVLISISRNPSWVTGSADPFYMGATTAEFQRLLSNYAAFHKAAAARYKAGSPFGTIKYWTVNNESNSNNYWKPAANAQRYAAMYAATAKAIKASYPGALVAAGPTNPTGNNGIRPVRFIKQFQSFIPKYLPGAQARTYLNAWAHNPYPGDTSPPTVANRLAPIESIGMANLQRLFTTLDRHPATRGTKVWATEFGWQTSGTSRVTAAAQAQYIAEAYDYLDAKRRVTLGITYGLTDPVEDLDFQSGTFYSNGTPKLSFTMFRRMVSVPQAGKLNKVKRNTLVKVWGRSNVNAKTGVLAFKRTGDAAWRIVPGQKRAADGSIRATIRATAALYEFSVYDAGNAALGVKAGYGLRRVFRTY